MGRNYPMPLCDGKNEISCHSQNLIYHSIFSYNFKTAEVEGVLKNNVEMLVDREGKLNDLEVQAQNLEEGTVIQN